MALDGFMLCGLVQELAPLLVNSRVQRVNQPNANDLILVLRQPGGNYRLLLSADPALASIHLTTWSPPNPLAPPTFCMLLRKHLEPARLLAIEQPGLERVVTFRFETRGETGGRAERWLIVEIMGRHSNILLVDPEGPTILDGIRRVSAYQSRHREVFPGKPYIAPPDQGKADPLSLDEDAFFFDMRHTPAPKSVAKTLAELYDGLSPDAAREIVYRADLPADATRAQLDQSHFRALWLSVSRLVQCVREQQVEPWAAIDQGKPGSKFWIFPLLHLGVAGRAFDNISNVLDQHHVHRRRQAQVDQLRHELLRPVRTAMERAEHRVEAQHDALAAAERAEEFKLKGELLLSYPQLVTPGAESVGLPNYYDEGSNVEVALDPALTASENAQVYYRRYQKARSTRQWAEGQLALAQAECDYLASVMESIERASDPDEIEEIREELRQQRVITDNRWKEAKKTTHRAPTVTEVRAPDSTIILVGRNNRQNDRITMAIARPNDLWLHTKNIPGAHVVIRSGGQPIADETLTLALHLAALNSKGRNSSQVAVDYCERRHVRKPKGAKPGFVIYDHHRTATITPSETEVQRLQAGRSD